MTAAPPAQADAAGEALQAEEAAVYDRQLRVWGVETQRKLTAAHVMIVGFGQLAAEIAKNITLAGVGNVTLLDDSPASDHSGRNFLITAAQHAADGAPAISTAEAAAQALQAMNPLIRVRAAPGAPADAAANAELLGQQQLVIASGLPLAQAAALDTACRAAGAAFMAAGAAGAAGWFFLDLQQHSFTPKDATTPRVLSYCPLEAALATPPTQLAPSTHPLYLVLRACWTAEQQLQRPLGADDQPLLQDELAKLSAAAAAAGAGGGGGSHAQEAAAQLLAWLPQGEAAPVCAVLGGVIANNVVAAVSGASAPLNNMLLYSLADGRAVVEQQPPAAAGAGGAQKQKASAAAAADVVDILD